jgi:type I restriction enzyme S subunit
VKWITSTLGELFEIARGGSPRPIKDYVTTAADGVNWIRIGDAEKDGKYIWSTEQKIKPAGMRRSRFVKEGDFILSNSMSFGRPYILKTNGCIHDGWLLLRPRAEGVDENFLYYALSSDAVFEQFENLAAGSVVRNLNADSVRSVSIAVPPLPEQRRIVGILDEAFAGIATAKANAEKNLCNARALFDSKLQGLFDDAAGWQLRTLADVSKAFGRGKSRHRPRNEPTLYGGKYPFIQTGDVRNADRIVASYTQTYSELGLAQSKLWPAGTVCITIAANIAETAILGFDGCIPDSIIGLVADETKADKVFVLYLLQSFKAHLKAQGKGSAQHNINMGTFEDQRFPFPSLKVQRKIVEDLDALAEQVLRLESIYRKKLAALDALRSSVLHQAFSGQLPSRRVELATA